MAQITKEALLESYFRMIMKNSREKTASDTGEGSGKRSLYGTCYQQIGYLYL